MQFGRFHAWALIALGLLLIVVQAVLFFGPKRDLSSSPEPPVTEHKTTLVPGIIGGAALVVGLGLYWSQRNKPQE
ncbi:MAG: hypothetical protein M3N22_04470 [Acidobacteriota bacterium]|nr:hypothetical protein [Acidobacteriota bacterium]